jgi:hypothetical protein
MRTPEAMTAFNLDHWKIYLRAAGNNCPEHE